MLTRLKKLIATAFVGVAGLGTFAFVVGTPHAVHAAEIVNVEYIVGFVKNKWGVDVPYEEEEKLWAANVEYLLKVVDYVNGKLNNGEKTSYGTGPYATKEAVDTIAANQAIRTLIKKKFVPNYDAVFTFVPETESKSYYLYIGAAGDYTIYWGDGKIENITQSDTKLTTYTHTYSDSASNHTIGLGGKANAYSSSNTVAAISFSYNNIKPMDGCLGCIFSTLADGSQPRFYGTFSGNTELTGSIPEKLFNGISGAPAEYMFYNTFYGCSGLTEIPEKLFSGISGAPAEYMFYNTFYNCSGLESIPANLFSGISGTPANNMFYQTFYGCSGLTGSVPENLFSGIKGAPADYMFSNTFYNCSRLESIPANLFGGISGTPANNMFYQTFYGCSGLKKIPENLFGELSGAPALSMFYQTFYGCSGLTGQIPEKLFGELSGAPAGYMFYGTFEDCSSLTEIPENLFAGISGPEADYMFARTFKNCSALTSIPEHLFDDLDTDGSYKSEAFYHTFYNCTSLSGPSARINGQYLYKIWPYISFRQQTYYNDTKLSDYDSIPSYWR